MEMKSFLRSNLDRVIAVGLAFVGLAQFVDVVAVRLAGGPRVGAYAAASSLARIAMYAMPSSSPA